MWNIVLFCSHFYDSLLTVFLHEYKTVLNMRRPVGIQLKQVYTIGTMKHGSDKELMVWGYFTGFFWVGTTLSHRSSNGQIHIQINSGE